MIVIPYRISRTFIQEHRELIFLFGNDFGHKGILGQPWFCVGESNCYQITTVIRLCPSFRGYFFDGGFEYFKKILDNDFNLIPSDGRPIIPFRKIGQGCSEMKKRAPRLFQYLAGRINEIRHPNIKIDYGNSISDYNFE